VWGLIIGFFVSQLGFVNLIRGIPVRATLSREGQKGLINPLLSVEISSKKDDFFEYKPLKEKLTKLINQKLNEGQATKISVYFRDLNNSHWTGVNENELYDPASLLKVPLMIAYYRIADDNPGILKKTIQYNNNKDENNSQAIQSAQKLIPDGWYSIDDLINRMIIYSDNNAFNLLLNYITPDDFNAVLADLSISLPPDISKIEDYISPKTYSYFFRTLYSSTYLSRQYSEQALELLSKIKFNDGLNAGLPKDFVVAHKFGERTFNKKPPKELHDCGIIYYTKAPYLLCVMTRGDDIKSLQSVIKDISSVVYDDVISVHSRY